MNRFKCDLSLQHDFEWNFQIRKSLGSLEISSCLGNLISQKQNPASYGSSFPFKEDLIQVIIMLIVGVIRVIRGKSRPPDGSTLPGPYRPNKMIHSFLQQWIIKKDYQVVFEKVPNI